MSHAEDFYGGLPVLHDDVCLVYRIIDDDDIIRHVLAQTGFHAVLHGSILSQDDGAEGI